LVELVEAAVEAGASTTEATGALILQPAMLRRRAMTQIEDFKVTPSILKIIKNYRFNPS
jgi:hypothetical protein